MTFTHHVGLRWKDIDPLGHANHADFLTYLEEARLAFLRTTFDPPADQDSWAIARIEIDYRGEIAWGDDLEVTVEPVRAGRTSVTVRQELRTQRGIAAEALVIFTRWSAEERRSIPLPEAFRETFESRVVS